MTYQNRILKKDDGNKKDQLMFYKSIEDALMDQNIRPDLDDNEPDNEGIFYIA